MTAWDRWWFSPATPAGLHATRVVLCLHALWILASRPALAGLTSWPPELWHGVSAGTRLRYTLGPSLGAVDPALWLLLWASLVAALLGIATRVTCLAAALLLCHFAHAEEILVSGTGPYLGGLGVTILGLVAVSSVSPRPEPDAEHRWPVVLVRALVALTYVSGAISRLRLTGLHWASAENIQATALLLVTWGVPAPAAEWVVDGPRLAAAFGAFWLAVELAMAATPFSRVAARIVVPLAAVLHVARAALLGIVVLDAPLLLVFVDGTREKPREAA